MKWFILVLLLLPILFMFVSCSPSGKKDNSEQVEEALIRLADVLDRCTYQVNAVEAEDDKAEARAMLDVFSSALPEFLAIYSEIAGLYMDCPTKPSAYALLGANSIIEAQAYSALLCVGELDELPKSDIGLYNSQMRASLGDMKSHLQVFKNRHFKEE